MLWWCETSLGFQHRLSQVNLGLQAKFIPCAMLARKGEAATSSFCRERALKPVDLFYSLNYCHSALVYWQALFSLFAMFFTKSECISHLYLRYTICQQQKNQDYVLLMLLFPQPLEKVSLGNFII